MQAESQTVGNTPILVLDNQTSPRVPLVPMATKYKVPDAVKFQPDDREKKIIEAAQKKLGLKKAQDILSMALNHWARAEQIAS